MSHPLHKAVGKLLDAALRALPPRIKSRCTLRKDVACCTLGTKERQKDRQNIPLFCCEEKSNKTRFCSVDALVLLDEKIKVIIEIEESKSGLTPVHIFGKLLASGAAKCYVHWTDRDAPVYKDKDVVFIQVLNTSPLPPNTAKLDQWQNIESAMEKLMPIGQISHYKILPGSTRDFAKNNDPGKEFIAQVSRALDGTFGQC